MHTTVKSRDAAQTEGGGLAGDPADQRALRDALGAFATGIAVITTAGDAGGPALGITVNSFGSVSLDPPLVLWSIDKTADRFAQFATAQAWSVSVLGQGDKAVSDHFARSPEPVVLDDVVAASSVPGEAPFVGDPVAVFACRTHACVDAGDHVIIIGRIEGFDSRSGPALTYFRGRYGTAE
jgi:flavin reductase (DIM6/NTAB) family NADH-FMN oxidoreductase RutF